MGNACQKSTTNTFENQCLLEHNLCRHIHGVPPLRLDRKLCSFAQEWAEVLAGIGVLNHRDSPPYGENLFMICDSEIHGSIPVKSWYNETNKYDFSNPGFQCGTGNFTQVIWKSSKLLGVGMAMNEGKTWVVANYDPPGNVENCFRVNVFPRDQR